MTAYVSAKVHHELAYSEQVLVSSFNETPIPSANCLIRLNKIIIAPVQGDRGHLTAEDLAAGFVLQLGQLLYARNGNEVFCARFIGGSYVEPTSHYERVLGL